VLNNLPSNHYYEVMIGVEEWRGSFGGYTEHMFDLKLHQDSQETTTFEVPVTKRQKVKKIPVE
jgi:hypothetical protein